MHKNRKHFVILFMVLCLLLPAADVSAASLQNSRISAAAQPQEPLIGTDELPQEPLGGTDELPQEPLGGTDELPQEPLGGTNELPQEPLTGIGELPQDSLLVPENPPLRSLLNPETGYIALIEDRADLLSEAEELELLGDMWPITDYGNVAFVSTLQNYGTAYSFADDYLRQTFSYGNSTVFLIDMDNRKIQLQSCGAMEQTITRSYANAITDNIYKYASNEDYYTCAAKAFEQEYRLLDGQKISRPMKYINNAFLSVILALLINYFIVMAFSRAKKPSRNELLGSIYTQCNISNTKTRFLTQSKVYSPPSSSSSGGGGGGHSGGGGGHSSGGGHSF